MTNSEQPKTKQDFLHGAAILTIGTTVSKVIGAIFTVALLSIITTEGMGHFTISYNIYIVLLTVASAGLPIAVSHLISEAATLKQQQQIIQIQRVSTLLFLIIGAICAGFMLIFSSQIASWMRDPGAKYAIAVLAPAVLFVCISSSFRGYFQGLQYMTPTAVAAVLENLCKLVLGMAAAYFSKRAGWGYPQMAGAAILGVTVGAALGNVYFYRQYRRYRIVYQPEEQRLSGAWQTVKRIFVLSIPITLSATGIQIVNALSSKIILGRLQDAVGLSVETASSYYGVFSMVQTLYLLPHSLVQPLIISVIPAVTEALALKNRKKALHTEESAVRMVGLIALPAGIGMNVLAGPLQALLYGFKGETLAIATPSLKILGISSILYCLIFVTNGILQVHERAGFTFLSTVAGGVVNIVVDYVLVANPSFHILGASYGNLAYCVTALCINLIGLRVFLSEPPRLLKQLWKPILAGGYTGLVAWAVYALLHNVIIAIAAAVLVYVTLIYFLKVLTWFDCQLLPKGASIARILRIKPLDTE